MPTEEDQKEKLEKEILQKMDLLKNLEDQIKAKKEELVSLIQLKEKLEHK